MPAIRRLLPLLCFFFTACAQPPAPLDDPGTVQSGPSRIHDAWSNPERFDYTATDPDAASIWIYIDARAAGRRVFHGWFDFIERPGAVPTAIAQARQAMNDETAASIDAIIVSVCHSFEDARRDGRVLQSNIRRGLYGVAMRHGDSFMRVAPTQAVSTNRSFKRLIELFAEQQTVTKAQLRTHVRYTVFQADQFLVTLTPPTDRLIERGNAFVPLTDVTDESLRDFVDGAGTWLANNIMPDGRMTYMYWPSASRESRARDNAIRQWMATQALCKYARLTGREDIVDLARRNIEFNLERFCRTHEGHGAIEWNGKIKLGAVALAALAMLEHPQHEQWEEQINALVETTDALWNPDGSLRSFLKPKGRADNQNFYPGEALLLWAFLVERDDDADRLSRFMQSFRYYRTWHLNPEHRNPAFVPWHTQAYFKVWQRTGDPELAAFIFTMNDWLLSVQQWESAPTPDTRGRFYDPTRPFGPPHASATGVYLEGLADAHELAIALDDDARAAAYEQAIRRGFRSIFQLQFTDALDMFYVAEDHRDRVRGGVRTTVYDNRIRCDNVQHPLLAAMKILGRGVLEDDSQRGR